MTWWSGAETTVPRNLWIYGSMGITCISDLKIRRNEMQGTHQTFCCLPGNKPCLKVKWGTQSCDHLIAANCLIFNLLRIKGFMYYFLRPRHPDTWLQCAPIRPEGMDRMKHTSIKWFFRVARILFQWITRLSLSGNQYCCKANLSSGFQI